MAYTKQTWQTGEVITAEKLNHIEDGIAEGNGAEIIDIVQTGIDSTNKPLFNLSYDDLEGVAQKYHNGKAVVRLQLLDNPSLNYYMNNARLYVDSFYLTSSSMTGDYYLLHACGTSVMNVSGNNIRIYNIELEVGRYSNRLEIRAVEISNA